MAREIQHLITNPAPIDTVQLRPRTNRWLAVAHAAANLRCSISALSYTDASAARTVSVSRGNDTDEWCVAARLRSAPRGGPLSAALVNSLYRPFLWCR